MTKEKLSQLYFLTREIEREKTRLLELSSLSEASTKRPGMMPFTTGLSDKTGNFASEIADLKDSIEKNFARCLRLLNEINEFIQGIDDSQTRQILSLRYINGLTWNQIAMSIGGNTEDSVRMIHNRFLKKLESGSIRSDGICYDGSVKKK